MRGTASGAGGYGVSGEATDSRGVNGRSQSGPGLYGSSASGVAVQGSKGTGQTGRAAEFTSTDAANDSTLVHLATAGDRPALRALNSSASAQAALRGAKTAGTDGAGVEGVVTSGGGNAAGVLGQDKTGSGSGSGIIGLTASGYGVRGIASASGGYGVSGTATDSYGVIGGSQSGVGAYGSSASGYGVRGSSSSSSGVYGSTGSTTLSGVAGVQGVAGSSGIGVLGQSATGNAVRGEASGSGLGVVGVGSGAGSIGVLGLSPSGSNATAVRGDASGTGRAGYFAVNSSSNSTAAVEISNGGAGAGLVVSQNNLAAALDVRNNGSNSTGIKITHPIGSNSTGLYVLSPSYSGYTFVNSAQLYMANLTSNDFVELDPGSIYVGRGNNALTAGTFNGNVQVTGILSKGGGSFKIDHPLDPANQYLYHSFVESPDMLNVYNGNVTLDAQGQATVTLPDYFEALNRDFRYQLTPIGAAFTPYVLAEVSGNQFRVAGQPGGKVSWQVTGIRHDKWANQNRIPNAVPKEPENRGKYLHPAAFGLPAARGIGCRPGEAASKAPKAATGAIR